VFSNAALHWVDDHAALFARLTAAVAAGGQLAVQMPANHDYPTHTVAAEVAGEPPFRAALGGWVLRSPVLAPEQYAALLDRLGYAEQHVRLQVYAHRLASRDDVVQWVQGTTLTAYRERLTDEGYAEFLARYRERLPPRLGDPEPAGAPFFYPFKRILLWAAR
jgi:trans-aconitate 2-methyltransferase